MHQKLKDIQLHYEGFVQTPCLWMSNDIHTLSQFEIQQKITSFNQDIDSSLRLGKYVERFVAHQLAENTSVKVIAENLQIQEDKRTLGEIDFLIEQNGQTVHIETIYKFYLYDPQFATNELECWIGPNKKDSLIEKLTKLRKKQLPLLHTEACKTYLANHNLSASSMQQSVYFKAQLFVPYSSPEVTFSLLNKACIVGFYIYRTELPKFKDCKFYIPTKKDWLIIPHTNVNWLSYEQFCTESNSYLERKFSPMFWMKSENGELYKFFLVWWQ